MKKKSQKTKKYNLLMYVADSSPKIKRFDSMEKMGKFVEKFHKKYPEHMCANSGYWIDYVVTGVTGEVHFFTDGIKVQ